MVMRLQISSKIRIPRRLLLPFHFLLMDQNYDDKPFTLLDIGCGNHSATVTKNFFPNCEYYGVDRSREYANDENDFKRMSGFYEMDVTSLNFDVFPDSYFDVINLRYIMEHLHNGDLVLRKLVPKLKKGGHMYLEWPRSISTNFPSRVGTLNFYDDSTHCRLYSIPELSRLLEEESFKVLRSGTKRDPKIVLLTPLYAFRNWTVFGRVQGPILWDLLGFTEYIYAEKMN